MRQAEAAPHKIVINDWDHTLSNTTYSDYLRTEQYPFCVNSLLINGKARIECLPESLLANGPGLGLSSNSTISKESARNSNVSNALSPRGCTGSYNPLPAISPSAVPDETCMNTTSTMTVLLVNASSGWIALNFVNAGSVSAITVSIDSHTMWVYAADGLYVNPYQYMILKIHLGQRYQVMVKPVQSAGNYYIRAATYPTGQMQQVLQSKAILSYDVSWDQ